MKILGCIGILVLLVIACKTIIPPYGPGTEYPCGLRGVECGGDFCCPENHICGFAGAFSRCEPGYCCYDGPPSAKQDAGSFKQIQSK